MSEEPTKRKRGRPRIHPVKEKTEGKKSKGGRPRIPIDVKSFEKLCELQCLRREIASFFDCSDDTIENFCAREYGMKFSDVYELKRGKGKIALRRYQFRLAETNATMAIWLGKQYLGQRDEQTINQNIIPTVIKDDIGDGKSPE